jgi:putative effector of murein hydrolase
MNKSITVFTVSMVVLYLLIAFVTLHIDFRLWHNGARIMYALFGPTISALLAIGYNDYNK